MEMPKRSDVNALFDITPESEIDVLKRKVHELEEKVFCGDAERRELELVIENLNKEVQQLNEEKLLLQNGLETASREKKMMERLLECQTQLITQLTENKQLNKDVQKQKNLAREFEKWSLANDHFPAITSYLSSFL
uniref:Uncharacterized protein n=1 Tax=Caenorhabditis japonica TaxID=281687 RepID=A0A8R1DS35_CAEJA